MPNNNGFIPKENLAKVEEVREIPTYQTKYTYEEAARLKEQFIAEQKEEIKKYQVKGSPLSPEARNKVIRKWGGGYVSENKEEYGPCSSCSGSNRNLTFKLKIYLLNCMGSEKSMTVYNTDCARSEANKIVSETGHWEDEFLNYFSQEDRRKLANKIKKEIGWHKEGHEVDDTFVCNKEMPNVEEDFKGWAEAELDNLASEPYPGERSGRSSFLD